MKIQKVLLVLGAALTFVSASVSSALVAGPSELSGTVKSFSEKTVTIENDQASYEIPREMVGVKDLKSGEKVNLAFSIEQAAKIKVQKKAVANKK